MVDTLVASDKVGLFLAARPSAIFHVVTFDEHNVVRSIADVTRSGVWINAGYFVFRREIFDYIREGEDLVEEPFERLIAEEKLIAFPYDGFWAPMDTLKDKQSLDLLVETGPAPWERWELGEEGQDVEPAATRSMIAVRLGDPKLSAKLTILAIGAHSDDIEIGCGGTLLRLAELYPKADVVWVVLSGDGERGDEARRSADGVPGGIRVVAGCREGLSRRVLPVHRRRREGVLRGAEG